MAFKTRAKASESDFEHPPGGSYPAVWIGLINLGTQPREYKGKKWEEPKIYFIWELVDEADSNGDNFIVAQDYTFSLHEKANLRKMIESYSGKPMVDDQELDLVLLIGKPCILGLTEGLSTSGKKFVEITSVQKPTKGQKVSDPSRKSFVWDFDLHEGVEDPEIPAWVPPIYGRGVVNEIKRSPEWATVLKAAALMPASATSANGTADDDDTPF